MRFRAVFFDLDGTLWDHVACSDYVMEIVLPKLMPHLSDVDPAEVVLRFNTVLIDLVRRHGLTGPHLRSLPVRFEQLLSACGIRKEGLARELSSTYGAIRRLGMRQFLRRSAPDVLGRLRNLGAELGVITNGAPAVQRHVIETLGLAHYFRHVVISEIEGYSKPDSRLFERSLELAGVRPKEMLYVGDSLITDVLGASRAGIPVAWLRTADRRLPDGFPVPDYDIADLHELLAIVNA